MMPSDTGVQARAICGNGRGQGQAQVKPIAPATLMSVKGRDFIGDWSELALTTTRVEISDLNEVTFDGEFISLRIDIA